MPALPTFGWETLGKERFSHRQQGSAPHPEGHKRGDWSQAGRSCAGTQVARQNHRATLSKKKSKKCTRSLRDEVSENRYARMGHPRGDQSHLERYGIDSNLLVAYLDKNHPDNAKTRWLAEEEHAANPTVIHEAYHTMVFKHKASPAQVRKALDAYASATLFIDQTLHTTRLALRLAVKHKLGGRDSLIVANYLSSSEVETLLTLDNRLLSIGELKYRGRSLRIKHPFK